MKSLFLNPLHNAGSGKTHRIILQLPDLSPYDQKTLRLIQNEIKETVANSNNTASNLSPPSGVNQTSNIESFNLKYEKDFIPSYLRIC